MIYKAEAFINLFQFTNSCFHKLELTDYMFVVIKKIHLSYKLGH